MTIRRFAELAWTRHGPTRYVSVALTPILVALLVPGWWWLACSFGALVGVIIDLRTQAAFSKLAGDVESLDDEAIQGAVKDHIHALAMITAAYGNQWIDLARDQDVQPLLRGGYLHRGDVTLRRQIWPRAALGAAYSTQFATVSGGMESFEIQRAEALLDVALGPTLTFSGRGGWAWQQAGFTGSQNAPSFAAELRYQGERTRMSIGYERTYLASFGFGGTVQNRSFQATLDAPINQRFDVAARATWRENDPLFATTLNAAIAVLAR